MIKLWVLFCQILDFYKRRETILLYISVEKYKSFCKKYCTRTKDVDIDFLNIGIDSIFTCHHLYETSTIMVR